MRWLLLLPFTSHHGMKTAAQCLVSQQGNADLSRKGSTARKWAVWHIARFLIARFVPINKIKQIPQLRLAETALIPSIYWSWDHQVLLPLFMGHGCGQAACTEPSLQPPVCCCLSCLEITNADHRSNVRLQSQHPQHQALLCQPCAHHEEPSSCSRHAQAVSDGFNLCISSDFCL